jgi:hypothetical protein
MQSIPFVLKPSAASLQLTALHKKLTIYRIRPASTQNTTAPVPPRNRLQLEAEGWKLAAL